MVGIPVNIKSNNGLTVVVVLMFMLALLVMTSVLWLLIQGQQQNVHLEEQSIRALNAADTGIEATIARISGQGFWYEGLPRAHTGDDFTSIDLETAVGDCSSYEVGAAKLEQAIGTSLALRSMGKVRAGDGDGEILAQQTLLAELGVFAARDYLRGLTVLPGAPAGLDLGSALVLDGDLVINGTVRLEAETVLNGVAYTSGDITGTWEGVRQPGYAYIPPFPSVDEEYYDMNAAACGEVYMDDRVFGNFNSPGGEPEEYRNIYFVDGNITIGGAYRGTALFFATGDITVAADLLPEPDAVFGQPDGSAGMLALVALGDVDIMDYTVYANILAAGNLLAAGGASLYGAACVTGLDFGAADGAGTICIHRQENLAPLEDFIPVKTKVVRWQELYPVFN